MVVTGGLGFLGLNAVERLVMAGARVRVICRQAPLSMRHAFLGGVDFALGDIRDFNFVRAAVAGAEVIFNFAGRSGAAQSNAAPVEDLDVNGRGHLTLLEACRHNNPRARVVFASSRLVYGAQSRLPVDEDAALNPLSIYGVHKFLGEQYHRLYARLYGLHTVVLRVTNPYGPHQHASHVYGIVNVFIRTALAGGLLRIFGDGSQERDFIHVDDVVRAFLLAGMSPECAGGVFNIGGGASIRFRDMAEAVTAIAGGGIVQFVPWPADAAASETGSFIADIRAASERLRWRPLIEFDEGLQATVREYRKGLYDQY